MRGNTPKGILDASLKQRYHRHGIYKMELIYVQTRVKGQGTRKLALEMEI